MVEKKKLGGMKSRKEFYFPGLFPRKVVLFSSDPFSKAETILFKIADAYLKATEGTDKRLIWVTTDQAANKMPGIFKEFGFDITSQIDRITFVDFVSGVGEEEKENVHYIQNPNNLIEVSMVLSDLFSSEKCELAIIDSINGLLAFNPTEAVVKFLRFLPPIAYKTNTSVILNYKLGSYGKEVESAIEMCADAVLTGEDDTLQIKMRSKTKKIQLSK